ncbi:MAG: hypothetical protein BRC35_15730 [Cyanobacteria bacterium QH_10_48_56]|nr:MAG: hypothetical protein BRC35_15730 [Cyanobacteria bacterium QH_10_48_56]
MLAVRAEGKSRGAGEQGKKKTRGHGDARTRGAAGHTDLRTEFSRVRGNLEPLVLVSALVPKGLSAPGHLGTSAQNSSLPVQRLLVDSY